MIATAKVRVYVDGRQVTRLSSMDIKVSHQDLYVLVELVSLELKEGNWIPGPSKLCLLEQVSGSDFFLKSIEQNVLEESRKIKFGNFRSEK